MNELAKSLSKFLNRDLMYIIGGVSFFISCLFFAEIKLEKIYNISSNYIVTLYFIGISYIIGYMNQEILSLTPLLTTNKVKPNKFLKWLYQKFTNSTLNEWKSITDYTADIITIRNHYKDESLAEIERIVILKQIGSAIGSNWLLSSMILFIKYFATNHNKYILFIALYLFMASIFLIIIAWIKGMQQFNTMEKLLNDIHNTSS